MWADLLSCSSWLVVLIGLFAAFVAWIVVSADRENKRKSEEIVRWAEKKRQEREEVEEVGSIVDLWEGVTSWFPFLPDPEPEGPTTEDLKRAVAHRLMSVSSLGTFARSLSGNHHKRVG